MIAATYNIQHGGFVLPDLSPIGADIAAVGAELVGLQEIDMLTSRCPQDSVAALCESSGLPFGEFAPAMDYRGGRYGTGILSREKPLSVTARRLSGLGLEPRVCAIADMGGFFFVNAHIAYENEAANRAHVSEVLAAVTSLGKPFILVGDFNTEDFSPFEAAGLTLANTGRRYRTYYPGGKAIDNIMLSAGLRLAGAGMYDKTQNSDHYMLWAEVEFI